MPGGLGGRTMTLTSSSTASSSFPMLNLTKRLIKLSCDYLPRPPQESLRYCHMQSLVHGLGQRHVELWSLLYGVYNDAFWGE